MAYSIGILPAAGKAERFGGIYKECLPYKDTTLLEHAYMRMPCEDTVVVTSREKIHAHADILGVRAYYLIQRGGNDIWSAMCTGMQIDGDEYYMTFPDTVIPMYAMLNLDNRPFQMGVFETTKPERFGCLHDGLVINKNFSIPVPAKAWGVLYWTREVKEFWGCSQITDYTDAINKAIKQFGCNTFPIEYYYDMASYEDYKDLIKRDL